MLRFLPFLLILIAIVVFAAWSLVRLLPLESRGVFVGTALLSLLVLGLFVLTLLPLLDAFPMPLSVALYEVGNTLLVASLYMAFFFLSLRVLRLIPLVRDVVADLWLEHCWLTFVVSIVSMGVLMFAGYGNYMNKRRVALSLPVRGLSEHRRIVMLSDLHLGYHNRAGEVRRWVALVNAEKPDIVVIAGDLVDHSSRAVLQQDIMSELRNIEAPVYASLGNHEYFAPMADVMQILRESNITLLRDSVVQDKGLYIIGRDDRVNVRRQSLKALMRQVPPGAATILLDHQPYHLEEAEQAGITLQLSGHTHHGQFWPGPWITERIYEKAHGYLRKGNTHYYVSSGMGIWGAKVRLGTQSEYIVIDLIKE